MVSLLFEKETPDHSDGLILQVWFHSIPYGYKIIYSCRHLEVQFLCHLYFPFPQCNEKLMIYPPSFPRLWTRFQQEKHTKGFIWISKLPLWYSFGIPPRQNAERISWIGVWKNSFGVSIFRNGNSIPAAWRLRTMLSNSLFSEAFSPALFLLFRKLMQACSRPFLHGE